MTNLFLKRIQEVQKKLNDKDILILFGATHKIRNRDVEYKFRQDSDFYYLTGIDESDAILVLKKNYSCIFVLPKIKEREIWTGIRLGKKKAKEQLNLTESFDTTEWKEKSILLLKNTERLFYFFGKDFSIDKQILEICENLRANVRNGEFGPEKIEIPSFLHEMRMIKSSEEIEIISEAASITSKGHLSLFKETKIGMNESELEAILEREYLRAGAWGGGYGHIVASGANATVLHYTSNNKIIKKGEIILVDSGAEKNYYTADVTRVFPSGKKFTPAQKDVYEIVLSAQKKAISLTTVGREFLEIHNQTVKELILGLKDLKFLKGSVDKNFETGEYRKFYMHRTGHWLGMDVHDVGKYYVEGKSIKLKNSMITTVEPGLYFDPQDKKIPQEFRGIGIRIEDDILVNENHPINLTKSIPKESKDIEEIRSQI
jgi:Xaa-Pro aminopeptidase